MSTSTLHLFNFFSQFCPIFGAVLADSYFGNSKTIFYFFIPYAFGFIGIIYSTIPTELVGISLQLVQLIMNYLNLFENKMIFFPE
jgi:dipeptide/tripeptide permease